MKREKCPVRLLSQRSSEHSLPALSTLVLLHYLNDLFSFALFICLFSGYCWFISWNTCCQRGID